MSKKLVKSRVISDAPQLGLANGAVLLATAAQTESLAKALIVDPHPSAVKYAEEQGGKEVKLTDAPDEEPAAEDAPT
jgi:hypothetical protein